MRRKKRGVEIDEETAEDTAAKSAPFLHGDAKRSIAAVMLFAFAALFVLGFFDMAGVLGRILNDLSGQSFGWGKWVFPPVLMVVGTFLLKRKQSSLAEFFTISGLAVAFAALLGFFHLFLNEDLLQAAKAGTGGGYIGFFFASFLREFTGVLAGAIVLATLLITGLIVAFNVSLILFFERSVAMVSAQSSKQCVEGGDESDEREERTDEEGMYAEDDKRFDDEKWSDEGVEESAPYDDAEDETKSVLGFDQETQQKRATPGVAIIAQDDLTAENIAHLRFSGEEVLSEEVSQTSIGEGAFSESVSKESEKKNEDFTVRSMKKKSTQKPWRLPSADLLDVETAKGKSVKNEQNAFIIQKTLRHFGIDVELGEIQMGPTVTQYTFRPTAGIKLSRITALSNDLALALAAQSIRIEAPIPGKSLVGIEVPNRSATTVRLKNILLRPSFAKRDGNLMMVLGQDVMGDYVLGDLRKMPHLLVAGATNSGKSVCINAILLSLLYQNSPDDLKLIMVDPKRVELSLYNKIPHLLTDVIVENKKVVNVLRWAVSEMERRYKMLQEVGSRDLASYRQKRVAGETRKVFDEKTNASREEKLQPLPYIVIVIDEMADLMMGHGKDVESLIVRLAQMSRAVGIHLILATQRPSVEVLTGLIKANITTRIAFQVATQIDSRTILDQGGAEKLLGRGDMLYLSTGSNQPRRLQGIFISEEEVHRVVRFLKKQKLEDGNEEDVSDNIAGSSDTVSGASFSETAFVGFNDEDGNASGSGADEDALYAEARQAVIQAKKASASLLQRRLRVGYSRAARLLDLLENDGVVGPSDGAKPREVYVSADDDQGDSDERTDAERALGEQTRRERWRV
jgi:S-DNA-T family DNA segregation ATPase FtsK/SpoIIIE